MHTELSLPRPREQVFAFFSDARNLEAITPDWLRFSLANPDPIDMRPGTIIDYRLRLHGVPLRWQSEIKVWEPPLRFVDEQRRGPYRFWRHEHRFEAQDGSTRVIDEVQYAVWGGGLVERWLVRRDVERIFEFRRRKLLERFGRPEDRSEASRAGAG